MKQLKSLIRHAVGAVIAFIIAAILNHVLVSMLPGEPKFGILYVNVFFAATIVFELWQRTCSKRAHYWRDKWFDTIIDVLSANIVFAILMTRTTAW